MVESSENATRTQVKVLQGRRSRLRIHFGDEVHDGEWPHNVFIFRLYDASKSLYRAFCAGNIITETRVLTSAHCFLTNKKNKRYQYEKVKFVAGTLKTLVKESKNNQIEQWRSADHVYSQRYYRFPAFNLAIAVMTQPWVFNQYVNKIPYATRDLDFDGVCTATAVKATRSWSQVKYLYTEEVEMLQRHQCEKILCRSCRLFMCSVYDNRIKYAYSETEGGGVVCYETGDPAEVDINQGVLVGVTTIINLGLPNLHMRVGLFNEWVTDTGCNVSINNFVIIFCIIVSIKIILV